MLRSTFLPKELKFIKHSTYLTTIKNIKFCSLRPAIIWGTPCSQVKVIFGESFSDRLDS